MSDTFRQARGESVSETVLNIVPEGRKRRTTRIAQTLPMRVTGADSLGRSFRERTYTAVVNCHGCKYVSKLKINRNAVVNLEIANPAAKPQQPSVRARVVSIREPSPQQEYFHIGVEFEVPGNVWGIKHPPDDWLRFLERSAAGSSALPACLPVSVPATSPGPASISNDGLGERTHAAGTGLAPSPVQPMAGLLSELLNHIQDTVSKVAAAAVGMETGRLLDELRAQLQEAQKNLEAVAGSHRNTFEKALQQSILESETRMEERSGRLGKQFEQAIRGMMAKSLEELERKSAGATDGAAENLQMLSKRYEKQARDNLQAAFELASEEATNRLQKKAAEILQLFIHELENHRRSHLEQIGRLTAELGTELVNRSRG